MLHFFIVVQLTPIRHTSIYLHLVKKCSCSQRPQ